MTDEERLNQAVQKVINDHDSMGELAPAWIATQAMIEIDFPRNLHVLGYVGCHLELRQIARSKLRHHFDPEAKMDIAIKGQGNLFPETLQDRYPRRSLPDEDSVYVRRDLMSRDDVQYNVERMRCAGRALLKHADALEAWDTKRRPAA